MDNCRLLRIGEVASLLSCSKVAVYRQAERGALPGFKVPGVGWRFDRDELRKWFEAQRNSCPREARRG